jgi:hypothetical protein
MVSELDTEVLQIIGKPKKSEVAGFGTVKFYANEPDKQFGFMASEAGDVFFHGSRCYQLANNGTDLPGLGQAAKTVEGALLDPPKRNDQVLFVAEPGPRGLRAVRWVKWSDDILDTVLDEITNRPTYQLVERVGPPINEGELVLGTDRKLEVKWEGQDLKDLKRRFSKTRYPVRDDDTGALYFLVQGDNSEDWNPCNDPR